MLQNFEKITASKVHPSWEPFFTKDIIEELQLINEKLDNQEFVSPDRANRLRFFSLDLNKAKAVILGQDPYPQQGVATGRAFEVNGLNSWQQAFRNTSLRNIVRALYASANEGKILKFNEIKVELAKADGFKLLAPKRLFKYWEEQGVLLLNTSFTCQINNPGSHSKIWKSFSKKLLTTINHLKPDLVWLLWGNHARQSVAHIKIENVLACNHPMICHNRVDDFLFGSINHFKATSEIIDWIGVKSNDS